MPLFRIIADRYLDKFERSCTHIEKKYHHSWQQLITIVSDPRLKNTSLKDLKDFPLTRFSDYTDAFEKAQRTGINPLNNEKVVFFLKSTGSTGMVKLIPLTKSFGKQYYQNFYSRAAQLYKEFNVFKLRAEHVFFIPGVDPIGKVPSGHMGLYLYTKIPGFNRSKWALPLELALDAGKYQQYGDIIILLSNLKGLSGTIPAGITAFFDRISVNRESVIRQIRNPDPVLLKMINGNKNIPDHRKKLVLALLENDNLSLTEVWPEIQFLCFWKAGAGVHQLKSAENKFTREVRIIDQVYNATEGVFNLPWLHGAGGPVPPNGILLEFKDLHSDKIYFPWEIEVGKEYEMLVTNFTGMIRYRIGDVIQCTGFYKNTPEIVFSRRLNHEVSFGWYTVDIDELNRIMSDFSNKELIRVAPDADMKGMSVYYAGELPVSIISTLQSYLEKHIPYFSDRIKDKTASPVAGCKIPAHLMEKWSLRSKYAVEMQIPDEIQNWLHDQRSR